MKEKPCGEVGNVCKRPRAFPTGEWMYESPHPIRLISNRAAALSLRYSKCPFGETVNENMRVSGPDPREPRDGELFWAEELTSNSLPPCGWSSLPQASLHVPHRELQFTEEDRPKQGRPWGAVRERQWQQTGVSGGPGDWGRCHLQRGRGWERESSALVLLPCADEGTGSRRG